MALRPVSSPPTTPSGLPLPPDGYGSLAFWKEQITEAQKKIDRYQRLWERNAQAYNGQSSGSWRTRRQPEQVTDEITVNKDFALVEQKKALLFFQSPEVQLTPLLPNLEDAISVFQPVLNALLGPTGVDAMRMMEEMLFDLLCPAGLGVTKIGYTAVLDPQHPLTLSSPIPPGETTPLAGAGPRPVPTMIPNVIYEEYFWRRASPAKLLAPVDFTGSDFDDAPWLGLEFLEDLTVAKREYALPDTFTSSVEDTHRIKTEELGSRQQSPRIRFWEIWYKASRFDPTVRHPQHLRRLLLADGVDHPLRHTDSPYQRFDPETGQLQSGMEGFPIHVCTLRYLADAAFPPSDSTISRVQVDELGRGRSQMVRQRERSIPMRLADLSRIGGEDGLKKLEKNLQQAIIPVESLDGSNPPIQSVQLANFPRENFEFNDIISQDINEYWALGANQRGQETDTARTATELQLMQQASSTRLEGERARVLRWYIQGVRKLASLVQLFADQQDYIQVLGPQNEQRLEAWDKTRIQGKFAFTAKPDSAIRIDAALDRKQMLDFYNLTANDPYINRQEIARLLARKYNIDPAKILQQPSPTGPPPPNVSVQIKSDSLDPRVPQFPILVEILRQGGYQISDQAIGQAQQHAQTADLLMGSVAQSTPFGQPPLLTAHGGAAEGIEPISQHSADLSGRLPGIGARGPFRSTS